MRGDFFKKVNFFVNKLFFYIPDRPGLILRVGFLRFVFLIGFIVFWHGLKGSTQSYPDFNQADISTGALIKVGDSGGQMGGVRNISLLVDGKEKRFKSYAIKETKFLKNKIGSIVTIWSYPWNDSFFIERNRIIEMEIDNKRFFNDWGEIKSRYDKKEYFEFIFLGFFIMFISLYLIFLVLRKYN